MPLLSGRATVLQGLTTRGRCLVAAGVAAGACALVLDERDLLRVALLLVALPVLCAVLLSLARLDLRTSRSVSPAAVTVGTPAVVTLTLGAGARLPVAGLLLSDDVPAALGEVPRYAVGVLPRGTSASVHYPLTPALRGRHTLGPVQVRLADPFGLVELVRVLPGTTEVLVRPALVDLSGEPGSLVHSVEIGGTPAGSRGAAQNVQDALVRPYQRGDDLRSVHWRSTARRDELMVRPQEQNRRTGTVVLLDVRTAAHHGTGKHSTFEHAISVAASVAAHLDARGRPVQLVTSDGVDLGRGESCLDRLAVLATVRGASLAGAVGAVGAHELIAVLGSVDAAGAQTLLAATTGNGPARAVVLGAEGAGVAVLRSAGWSVVVARERTPTLQVWQQLCAGAAELAGAGW